MGLCFEIKLLGKVLLFWQTACCQPLPQPEAEQINFRGYQEVAEECGTVADCVNVCLLISKVRVPCVRFGRPFGNVSYGPGVCVNREEGAFGTNLLFSALALSFPPVGCQTSEPAPYLSMH